MTNEAFSFALKSAWSLADRFHEGQMYGVHPYRHHLAQTVLNTQLYFPDDVELPIAAILHDILEDTKATVGDLQLAEIPEGVIALVQAVTNQPGANRKKKRAATLPVIVRAGPQAIALKCCDRLANVNECWNTRSPLLRMYWEEYQTPLFDGFRDGLQAASFKSGPHLEGLNKIWLDLDRAHGREPYPWDHKKEGSSS
jgi:(p)ppGpp synthase/HD superfamily hydrolase